MPKPGDCVEQSTLKESDDRLVMLIVFVEPHGDIDCPTFSDPFEDADGLCQVKSP